QPAHQTVEADDEGRQLGEDRTHGRELASEVGGQLVVGGVQGGGERRDDPVLHLGGEGGDGVHVLTGGGHAGPAEGCAETVRDVVDRLGFGGHRQDQGGADGHEPDQARGGQGPRPRPVADEAGGGGHDDAEPEDDQDPRGGRGREVLRRNCVTLAEV